MFLTYIKARKEILFSGLIDLSLFVILYFNEIESNLDINLKLNLTYFCLSIIWILISYVCGRYSINNKYNYEKIISIFTKFFLCLFITFTCIAFGNFFISISKNEIIYPHYFYGIITKISILSLFIQFIFLNLFKRKTKRKVNIVFLGKSIEKIKIIHNEESKLKGLNLISLRDYENENQKKPFEIVVDEEVDNKEELKFLQEMSLKGILIYRPIDFVEKYLNRALIDYLDQQYFKKSIRPSPIFLLQLRLKRLFDIFFSFFILILSLPFCLIAIILIKCEDNGPIFYSQIRNGLNNQTFKVYKFRSMKVNSEPNGPQWAKNKDNRITKLGTILRKSRIDELPQLFNVIIGEMSLIGPRPERPEIDDMLEKKINLYTYRYSIKPGLSGWAQVNYPYGASLEDSKNKLSFDFFYIKNYSFLLDVLILFKTIKTIVNLYGSVPYSYEIKK